MGRIIQYRGGILLPNLNVDSLFFYFLTNKYFLIKGIVFIRCTSDGIETKDERKKERKWGKVSQNLFLIDKGW